MIKKLKAIIRYDLATESKDAAAELRELACEGFTLKTNKADSVTGIGEMMFVRNTGRLIVSKPLSDTGVCT